ncbi:unnamed protein product [Rotaria sordida]|uniref:F-box domain-containing protein n=1 Tax=Rotaria sordida TaxID=392033 RepID=A0A814VXW8_9BILA|nr:unnamed protein product [Rotaria sordida]CAF3777817.1 unnamed protein product [Rotaria sordida]
MKLESLANELILELFEFFNAIQLLRAFHGLNSRFDTLLDVHFRAYSLDFRSVSKHDFDIFCQQQLPSLIDRVASICLSDDDETPNLPDHFLSYNLTINIFTNLRSLALYGLHSTITVQKFILDCRKLPCLTHLKVTDCRFKVQKEFIRFINTVWHLTKLIHCHFDNIFESTIRFIEPKEPSLSIEHFSITNTTCQLNGLTRLLKQTPHLRRLYVSIAPNDDNDDERMQVIHSSITTMTLLFHHSIEKMTNFLKIIPNLLRLTIDTTNIYLNGQQWQQIIVNQLQKLKIFRFRMIFSFPVNNSDNNNNIEKQIDLLLDTFRTPFWLDEHHWFVRCDWNPQTIDNISLYTVPYAFDTLSIHHSTQSKWTCPNDSNYWSYNRVQHFWYQNDLFQDLNVFPARFLNIHHLRIRLPVNDNFWSVIPTLHRLTSLDLSLRQSRTINQINALLDRTPHIYSLTIEPSLFSRIATLENFNKSIRRLNFFELSGSYFDNVQCSLLVNSSLGHQCKVLVIGVEHRTNAYFLITHISNLRVLIFRCRDDKWHENGSSSARDELLSWLKNRLPSTYSISRNVKIAFKIRVWK